MCLLSACSPGTRAPMDHADSSPSVHASLPPSTPAAVPVETASEPIVAGTFDIAVVGEASGVARSVRNSGWVYVLDDGPGSTGVLAIDTATNAATTVTVAGLEGRDTEGLAVGDCGRAGAHSCLFIGDIGNNQSAWESVSVWRIREPPLHGADARITVDGDVATYTYPDAPVNAEALLVERGAPYLVTKPERLPASSSAAPKPHLLGARRFADGELRDHGAIDLPEPETGTVGLAGALLGNVVTGGEKVGDRVVLRTYDQVAVYTPPEPDARLRTLRAWRPHRVATPRVRQGEAVTMDACGIWLTSEGVDSVWLTPWRSTPPDDEQEQACPTGNAHS